MSILRTPSQAVDANNLILFYCAACSILRHYHNRDSESDSDAVMTNPTASPNSGVHLWWVGVASMRVRCVDIHLINLDSEFIGIVGSLSY